MRIGRGAPLLGLSEDGRIRVHDHASGLDKFRAEVIHGLRKAQKELSAKYLYDERGSSLFERICTLDEYYIPRTEVAIMQANIQEIAGLIGPHVLLIEYGSGDCAKTRILLDNLRQPAAYVPIDIYRDQLLRVAGELVQRYPGLEVLPVRADYMEDFDVPHPGQPVSHTVVFFPGSSIGNFDPTPAQLFLERVGRVCGPGGGLLIGVDRRKDPVLLHHAYNDREGVTAAFNLNLLERINRELNSDFRLEWFQHYAFYNAREGRVEMHLVSLRDQTVHLGDVPIPFARGESIWTESSYKYSLGGFSRMAAAAGFRVARVWTDKEQWFSVLYLAKP